VDTERIGGTGCSGGGTLATHISALDPRIKVAAPTCYMNFIRILGDFSTPEGAGQVYDEARCFYRIFGAEEKLRWVVAIAWSGPPQPARASRRALRTPRRFISAQAAQAGR
jgi:hypothetical protein